MAIPLRVVQQFYDEKDGTRVWTNYRLEVMTAEGWAEVPVVVQEVARPQVSLRLDLPFEGKQL
jgi:hypothetical protein